MLRGILQEAWLAKPARHSQQDIAAYFMDLLDRADLLSALNARLHSLAEELATTQRLATERLAQPGSRPTVLAIFEHARTRIQAEIGWTRDLLRRVQSGEFATMETADDTQPVAAAKPQRRAGVGQGAFTFVLHTHIPYCRLAGRWPHGEEWLHEAIAETYVPLLNALYDLRDDGVPFRITIGLTPVLVEQLADLDVREHFLQYLSLETQAAQSDIPRFGEEGCAHLEYLATFYRDFYTNIRKSYLERFGGDLVQAFRRLQDEGYLEIATCAATHGYLPLLSRDSSIYGQLRAAVASYRHHFGRSPRAVWLPECAYRPAYVDDAGVTRPAIEEFLSSLGITCFFVETHAIEGGHPVGKAAGDVAIGPYAAIRRHYVIPVIDKQGPGGTTFAAYHAVGNSTRFTEPAVAAIGRNNRIGQQVWSADWGYPGDGDYREFHKKDHLTGMQYWRVTGPNVELGDKDIYHPDWAQHKVASHASHFAALVEKLLAEHATATGEYGIVAANYDTELFGHWWFEGIDWIREVLRTLAASSSVDLTTASAFVASHPPQQNIALPESSWGAGGNHWTWDNPDTRWMWVSIHQAEQRMEALVEQHPDAEGDLAAALNQAARELLLLQSSDWPFLVTTGQAKQYAVERFRGHLGRFDQLVSIAISGVVRPQDCQLVETLFATDNVFPRIDYRWFRQRQGSAD